MNYYLFLTLILFIYVNIWFAISLLKKRNDVADIAWGLGFPILAWTSFFLESVSGLRGLLVNTLVSIWGLRLAWHIYSRNKNNPEDYRYLKWRKEWGKWFYLRSYMQIYILQGFLMFLISLPLLSINQNSYSSLKWLDFIGIMIWLFGFFFEAVSDAQLSKFLKNPANKGKLMTTGLWKYTRHPNYFGEVTLWWGIWLISVSETLKIFTIIGPLTITFLILKVSGIPMLEKRMEQHPDFAKYKEKTSAFIPWFVKKNNEILQNTDQK
jgi:steroid 5-alpha reductase family enzyme